MACKQNKQNICTSKAKLLVAEFELVIAGLSLRRHAAKFELVIAGLSLHLHAARFELVIAGFSLHRHAAKFELVIAGFSLHRHAAPLCMAHFFVLASAGLQLLHPFRISFVFSWPAHLGCLHHPWHLLSLSHTSIAHLLRFGPCS